VPLPFSRPGRRQFVERPEDPERVAFFADAARLTGHVSVAVDGVTYVISTGDRGVGEDLFVRQLRPELIVLRRALQVLGPPMAGRTAIVDVGANLGTTILPALRSGFTDGVACEPGPETAELLRVNCALNGAADRVTVVEAAVSSVEGVLSFDVSRGTPGRYAVDAGDAEQSIVVPAVTIDGLVERGTIEPARVGLFWIDAQGHEPEVLAAAGSLLAEAPPLVFAARQKKLEEGRLAELAAVLDERYERIVDLRSPDLVAPRWRAAPRPLGDLQRLVEQRRTTDLLALPRGRGPRRRLFSGF
jgi:FkbM family methyltransferase